MCFRYHVAKGFEIVALSWHEPQLSIARWRMQALAVFINACLGHYPPVHPLRFVGKIRHTCRPAQLLADVLSPTQGAAVGWLPLTLVGELA